MNKRLVLKALIAFLFFCGILLNGSIVWADNEEMGPPIEEVFQFESFELEILNNGKFYTGILLSEEEYIFYSQLKFKYKLLSENLEISKDYGEKTKASLDLSLKGLDDISKGLVDIKNTIVYESWFDQHKFGIGVGVGVVLSIITAIIVVEVVE